MRLTAPLWKSVAVLSLILWGCAQDTKPINSSLPPPSPSPSVTILYPESTTQVDSAQTTVPIVLSLSRDIQRVEIYVDGQLLRTLETRGDTLVTTTWLITEDDLRFSRLIEAWVYTATSSVPVKTILNVRLECPSCPSPPPPSPGPYRYEEFFSDPSALRSWWMTPHGEFTVHEYPNGVLTITGGRGAVGVTYCYPVALKALRNATIGVDTKWQDGTTLSAYGVWCRFSSEGHYRFCINGEGQFSILRYRAATQTLWPLQDWMRHRAIPPKGDNHLQVLLQDSKLTFVVNSDTVATVYDDTITSGGVVLYVEGIQRVDFDNLIVEEPP